MKPEEFRRIIEEAVSGSHEALERVFELYAPLINGYSQINGKLDEDLKQYILIHIAFSISKFGI